MTFDFFGTPFVLGALPMVFHRVSYSRPVSYSPFPADPNLTPVTQSMRNAQIPSPAFDRVRLVGVVALEPVAHIRRDFEITGLRLVEYEAP
ncbi:MAG TPA: hypothetical protein VN428_16835 [Bryobacteraceae bacterium]|nr:hypothetical protein [Bryobacteraceae bacterium]